MEFFKFAHLKVTMESRIKELILAHSTELFGSEISENLIQFQPIVRMLMAI